jgi:hypothetical protein
MRLLQAVDVMIALLLFSVCGAAQQLSTDESAPRVLVRIIPIPGVVGRFDHAAVDNRGGRVFAAVYGMTAWKFWIQRVALGYRGVKEEFIKPQTVAYLPDMNRIAISNEANGSCKIMQDP